MADSQSSLREQVRSGGNRQLQLLAAEGVLPLPPEELIALQVDLAQGEDAEVAGRARTSLQSVDVRLAKAFLEGEAGEEVLGWFAEEGAHPVLLEAVLRRRDVPRRLLARLARRIPPDLQEILLLRQDAIIEEPFILEALEENPQVSGYSLRRIAEFREHLLPRQRSAPAPATFEEMDDAALEAALDEVRPLPESGEIDTEKTKLTRGAPRTLRSILLRDSNAQVAVSVIINNNLTDQEVEQTAASRAVVEEVLALIAKKRDWVAKYHVAKALVFNPRTPLPTAIRLVARLSVRDLKELGRDRNVPDAVRSTGLRLYRIKQQ